MYFPYLRGRQFELLAIRELVENDLIGSKVIPIIEPIKPSSTLFKTLELFVNKNKSIAVIHNPQVGKFRNELSNPKDKTVKETFENILKNQHVIFSHIVNSNTKFDIASVNKEHNISDILAIINNVDDIDYYLETFNNENPQFTLIPDEGPFRRNIKKNKILLADRFNKLLKNADYYDCEDESYSEDHLYFSDEKYIGFSDYSVVGAKFLESGFAPYAVVIHIVYFDKNYNLRIKHFVSESNDDINDPAGKFYEALEKLMEWQSDVKIDTYGMKEFEKHYENGTYPGLGTVKKLSIMHHLELMSSFLVGACK